MEAEGEQEGYMNEERERSLNRFLKSRDEAMALSLVPYFENKHIHFPNRSDSYRLKYEEDRSRVMGECSSKTLDYFNRANGTDYEFDEYVDLVLSDEDHSFTVHCNFFAKPGIAPLKPGDFSPKLFFAELILFRQSVLFLTYCSILDGAEDECEKGCSMCPSGVISHPLTFEDGFKLPLENDEGYSIVPIEETPWYEPEDNM